MKLAYTVHGWGIRVIERALEVLWKRTLAAGSCEPGARGVADFERVEVSRDDDEISEMKEPKFEFVIGVMSSDCCSNDAYQPLASGSAVNTALPEPWTYFDTLRDV